MNQTKYNHKQEKNSDEWTLTIMVAWPEQQNSDVVSITEMGKWTCYKSCKGDTWMLEKKTMKNVCNLEKQ